MQISKEQKSELVLLIITLIWGGTFLFTKIGLQYCPPFFYIVLRFSLALLICFLFFTKHLLQIDKETLKQGAILGLLFGGGFMLQTYALLTTSITKTAFITGLTVVMTPFAFRVVFKKNIARLQIIGVLICGIGLYIFTNPSFDDFKIGDLLTLISTMFWAFYITFLDKFTKERHDFTHTIQIVALQFFSALPLALIAFFLVEYNVKPIIFNFQLLQSLAYNGIIASFFLSLLQTKYQKNTTPVKASLIYSLEPIFASFIAIIAINEILSLREYVGAIILLSGVAVSEFGDMFLRRIMMR
ncbi:MAG: DMT family transporter [Candidatus Kapabacteria bacterium]|nr:DMT family transporter [Candidatus Kapabacteria bacterium]